MTFFTRHKTFFSLPLLLFFIFLPVNIFAQQANQDVQIRIQLWAELDAYPGLSEENAEVSLDEFDENNPYAFPIARMKQIAPFIFEGMLYGWNYDYTPYDKTRHIDEYFSYEAIKSFNKKVNPLEYHQPLVKNNRVNVWVYCTRTPTQQMYFNQWKQVNNPKVRGIGQGSIEKGFDGIKEACEAAIKNAVREYWRQRVKNKPRRITGKVILIHNPVIYIKDGKYTADLDFFMETDKITPYAYY
jgi:hypothetical protein